MTGSGSTSHCEGVSLADLVVIYEMRNDRVTWKWISRVMGLSASQMKRAVARAEREGLSQWINWGPPTSGEPRKYTDDQLRHAMYLRTQRYSWKQVAEQLLGSESAWEKIRCAVRHHLKRETYHDQRLFRRRAQP